MHEFFVGLHHPADATHVQPSFISINALRNRCSGFPGWEGGCSTRSLSRRSQSTARHRMTAHGYAAQICYWKQFGELLAAVNRT